jgi:hypothetical protein
MAVKVAAGQNMARHVLIIPPDYLQGLWQVLTRAAWLNRLQPGRVTQDSGL